MSGLVIGGLISGACVAMLGVMVWLFNAAQDPREDFEPFEDSDSWGGR